MCVCDKVAAIAGEESVDSFTIVALRVAVEHVLIRSHEHPEVAFAAFVLGQHEHARRVEAQVRRLVRIHEHFCDQRRDELGERIVPRAERRLGDVEAFARVDAFEPVKRLVILPPAHDRVRQH